MARRKGRSAAGSGAAAAADATAATKRRGRKERKELTPARAKRMIGIGTAVAPLLAPYAIAAAGVARERWDAHRARRLGVPADQLGRFTGRGGALFARIDRASEALTALADGSGTGTPPTESARRFVTDVRPRLEDLSVAVRAAEQMPAARRRVAFRAVGGELDRIEDDLLRHLGLTPPSAPSRVPPG